jgi:hypothetical protein
LTRHLLRKEAAVDIELQHDEPPRLGKRVAEAMEARAPSSCRRSSGAETSWPRRSVTPGWPSRRICGSPPRRAR